MNQYLDKNIMLGPFKGHPKTILGHETGYLESFPVERKSNWLKPRMIISGATDQNPRPKPRWDQKLIEEWEREFITYNGGQEPEFREPGSQKAGYTYIPSYRQIMMMCMDYKYCFTLDGEHWYYQLIATAKQIAKQGISFQIDGEWVSMFLNGTGMGLSEAALNAQLVMRVGFCGLLTFLFPKLFIDWDQPENFELGKVLILTIIDDVTVWQNDIKTGCAQLLAALTLAEITGVKFNVEKGTRPFDRKVIAGFYFDLRESKKTVLLPDKKRQKYLGAVSEAEGRKSSIKLATLQKVLGISQHVSEIAKHIVARLSVIGRAIGWLIKRRRTIFKKKAHPILWNLLKCDLQVLKNFLAAETIQSKMAWCLRTLEYEGSIHVTDASGQYGMGGHREIFPLKNGDKKRYFAWSINWAEFEEVARAIYPQFRSQWFTKTSINVLETLTLGFAQWIDRRISKFKFTKAKSDNTTAVKVMNSLRGSESITDCLAMVAAQVSFEDQSARRIAHIPGKVNTLADDLSRKRVITATFPDGHQVPVQRPKKKLRAYLSALQRRTKFFNRLQSRFLDPLVNRRLEIGRPQVGAPSGGAGAGANPLLSVSV